MACYRGMLNEKAEELYMKKAIFSACILLVFSDPAFAQQSLVGKYTGGVSEVPTPIGNQQFGLTLEILTTSGNTVTGKAEFFTPGACGGEYPVAGKRKGDTLTLRATKKGGAAGDCGLRLELTVEGDKLVGTMNRKFPAQLSK